MKASLWMCILLSVMVQKISEVCRNVQDKVKYNLDSMLGITAESVNVIVQGVRVIND